MIALADTCPRCGHRFIVGAKVSVHPATDTAEQINAAMDDALVAVATELSAVVGRHECEEEEDA